MHWRGARQLRCTACTGRGWFANPGHSGLADGRSDGRAYGKGRAQSLSGEDRDCGGDAGAACATAEVPPGTCGTAARQEIRALSRQFIEALPSFARDGRPRAAVSYVNMERSSSVRCQLLPHPGQEGRDQFLIELAMNGEAMGHVIDLYVAGVSGMH